LNPNLFFVNGDEQNSALRLETNSEFNTIELPPIPPVIVFDVRFSNDRYNSFIGEENLIQIQGMVPPLKIKLSDEDDSYYLVTDILDGKVVKEILSNANEVTINSKVDFLKIKRLEKHVFTFSLSQNYPNPFNPTTYISFSLQSKSKVRLVVYDILGNEIQTLVNDELSEGKYSIKFDGSNLASGIYIYKLITDKFTDVKKMILMK
jgi:flagellar hook assembly protein FlgD